MKRILLVAPFLALGACATDDLADFANSLDTFAYALENELNPPCPGGMYREFVPETLATVYPQYGYQPVGYQLTPGGYSYCAYPVTVYTDYGHRHGGGHGHGGRRDRDNDYRDGYRDGYRDAERDDRRD